ncbi:transposase [Pseudaminobacter sp. 19-2017]|uniref:Transposase n=1 Tax=Pseudaminobacter soli (ex Zhang et al. 2022) TaxID=2831468 RepID=A0A942I3W4_9HYPH|nr:transposase [Pseudaminobacter soli]MBS3651917.1 transposase [Pseudaminobacter soli]
MPDPEQAESEVAAEQPAKAETPEAMKKARAQAPPSGSARRKGTRRKSQGEEVPVGGASTGRKLHSEKERAQKISQIEESISGGTTLKDASKQAGISAQTYYHWKKAAAPASSSDDLKDLIALEEENKRLKSLLAERLRRENAELKRKLGIE